MIAVALSSPAFHRAYIGGRFRSREECMRAMRLAITGLRDRYAIPGKSAVMGFNAPYLGLRLELVVGHATKSGGVFGAVEEAERRGYERCFDHVLKEIWR